MTTSFQKSVWKALSLIPKGRVTTYGDVAKFLQTKAVRAVGSAVGKNPDAPKVPCHRVVCADGRMGEYSGSGGVDQKKDLLRGEGIEIENGKIQDFPEVRFSY